MRRALALSTAVLAATVACGEPLVAAPAAPPADDGGAADAAPSPPDAGGTDGGLPCPDASCGKVIAQGQMFASEVLVDEARVYWTIEESTGGIMARPLDDSREPYRVTDDKVRATSLSRWSEQLHWCAGAAVSRHLRTSEGGASTTVAELATTATSARRSGGKVFVTAQDEVRWCSLVADECLNDALDKGASVGPNARALVVDPSDVRFWLATDDAVWSSETATPNLMERWRMKNVRALLVDETSVFVARTGVNGLARFGVDDGMQQMPVIVAGDMPPPWAMTMDGTHVYYTALDEQMIVRVEKSTGRATVLAAPVPRPKGIAVDGMHVYVALSDGRVVALPKFP